MGATSSNARATLSPEELNALRGAVRRLHVELRAFLAALPASAQTASGLSRYLDIERTTCQRAVHAAVDPAADLGLVRQLPGVRGLRMLVEAAGARADGGLRAAVGTLHAAIEEYEQVTRRLASSRSTLLRRIAALEQGVEPETWNGDELRLRQMLFSAAAGLTGRYSETWLAVHTYEPIAGNPGRVATTRAHGLIGHVATEQAVPLTFHVFGSPEDADGAEAAVFRPLTPEMGDSVPAEILRDFSTRPLPIVHTKQPNEFMVQTLDASPDQSPSEPLDILFGMWGELPHPATTAARVEDVWALVNFPVKRLLLDVFLHRDLARRCIPGLDVHLWRPDFASHEGERWQTRFAHGPKLEVLGVGLEPAATDAYARYGELVERLFAARGLVPEQYVGFRCDVAFPMWRTGYRMSFDFGEGDGSGG